ncbi:MAG TPA: IS110 family transposase [Ktedonobacteraceae bacterium]|nr:IS110 family transposase [Ktedonobacteraceae bacterium]
MELIYQRCCGIDIHKKMIVACLITETESGQRHKETRTFRTVSSELLHLLDWLKAAECTHVAMESTGVYWKPIYNILEGHFELLVVNAQHIKAVPGRKTDVKDAEWIADLLQHGLLKGSYIPPAPQRELRELTRYRVSLIQERARAVNRLQKTLEDTNLKLGDVATDIMGKSARAMLEALLAGQTDPSQLADLERGRLKAKRVQLEEALVGTVKPHHRFMLSEQLVLIDTLDEAIERVSQEIAQRLDPPPGSGNREGERQIEAKEEQGQEGSEIEARSGSNLPEHPLSWKEAVVLLDSIPGINQRAAEGILAEIGIDMSRFPTAGHLASWAGMCPGSNESAGKRLSGKTRKGSPWLRKLLVEVAHAAAHSKNTYLSAFYHRIKARVGAKQAMIAVGHTILVAIYHMLARNLSYQELGGNYFDEHDRQAVEKRLVRRLEKLGYQVSLEPAAQVA